MPLYVVIRPLDEDDQDDPLVSREDVERVAQEVVAAGRNAFVIRTSHDTGKKLAGDLGIGVGTSPKTGLVFKISTSHGYYYQAFWTRLNSMMDQS